MRPDDPTKRSGMWRKVELPEPPPANPIYRRPGMAKCSPEREAAHRAFTAWFRAWCEARRISERDLAAILDVSAPLARQKLSGKSPLNLVDVQRFPDRHRNDLLFAFLANCAATSSKSA